MSSFENLLLPGCDCIPLLALLYRDLLADHEFLRANRRLQVVALDAETARALIPHSYVFDFGRIVASVLGRGVPIGSLELLE